MNNKDSEIRHVLDLIKEAREQEIQASEAKKKALDEATMLCPNVGSVRQHIGYYGFLDDAILGYILYGEPQMDLDRLETGFRRLLT